MHVHENLVYKEQMWRFPGVPPRGIVLNIFSNMLISSVKLNWNTTPWKV